MAGMMAYLRELLDDLRDPRQRPEIRTEPRHARAGAQGPLDLPQLRRREFGFAPRPARSLEGPAPLLLPRVIPVVRRHARDAQHPCHRRLRLPLREQARRSEPTRFQRGKIPARSIWSPHASTCDRTREIR
jgi:hypothetical protein